MPNVILISLFFLFLGGCNSSSKQPSNQTHKKTTGHISSGGNDIQVFNIPHSTIQTLQNNGIKNAELRMEVLTLKRYSRWSHILNLFILSPDNTPVTWSHTDEELSYKVATSNDITSSIDRYLEPYGGHLNYFEVTGEYTNTILSHAQKALDSNKIEGVVSREVMMNPPESEIFSLYQKFIRKIKINHHK